MLNRRVGFQAIHAADHFVNRAEAQLRHDLPRILGHHEQVIHDMLGLAGELLAEHRVLRGHAHRARVEMTLSHHDATQRHERRRGETEFLRTQDRGDHHIAARLEPAVGLQHDAAAQVVEHERLVRFGNAQFPRQAGVLDAGERRRAGTAGIAGNQNVIGKTLGHAGRDRADAHFGDELHAHPRRRVAVLQIVDELLEILDRINIMMRRRTDEPHAGRRVADAGDVGVDLSAGQLAAFARLRALRNLDLQFVGIRQVPNRDAKPAARHLLDRRPLRIAVGQQLEPLGVFATFARVAFAAEPVHRDRQRFVCLGRDRAKAHRAGAEPLHDLLGRHHFVERNWPAVGARA